MWEFQCLALTFEKIYLHRMTGERSASGQQNMLQSYIHLELAKELVSLFVTLFHRWDNCCL
jgi:hypothetical protein